jgi:hypothetical protein
MEFIFKDETSGTDILIGLTFHNLHCRNFCRMFLSDIPKLVRIVCRKMWQVTSYSWENDICCYATLLGHLILEMHKPV